MGKYERLLLRLASFFGFADKRVLRSAHFAIRGVGNLLFLWLNQAASRGLVKTSAWGHSCLFAVPTSSFLYLGQQGIYVSKECLVAPQELEA